MRKQGLHANLILRRRKLVLGLPVLFVDHIGLGYGYRSEWIAVPRKPETKGEIICRVRVGREQNDCTQKAKP